MNSNTDMNQTLNEIKHRLSSLQADCDMALDGTWDKSDDGFKAMLDEITVIFQLLYAFEKDRSSREDTDRDD